MAALPCDEAKESTVEVKAAKDVEAAAEHRSADVCSHEATVNGDIAPKDVQVSGNSFIDDAAKEVQPTGTSTVDVSFFRFPLSSKEATLLVSALSVKEPVASAQPAPPCSKETIVTVNVHAAKDLIASGHRFLDVRTKEEFSNGHLENSINVPFLFFTPQGREKNPQFLEEVSSICCKDDHIVVSCQTGNRGSMACTALLSADFKNVKNMGGGFEAWESNGFELKKPEDGSRMAR
ncbi:Rhodanese-like domain-containing protein 19 [Nymphaea thermarum]|nr:Rhodanese-like domain-containing protein 19 [Nymphaea thermarum]